MRDAPSTFVSAFVATLKAALRPRLEPSTYAYLAVAILATAPAWIVKHPPLVDMPFHVATLRVVHDFHNPAFAFTRDFVLNLSGTQYVLYYLVGSALAYLVGVANANVLMLSVYLGGTPLAMRALLKALGKDPRPALLTIPMLVNAMFIFGFMPFLFGVPLMLAGVALAARYFEKPTLPRGLGLAFVGVCVFYAHIFPFAVFGLGVAALFPWAQPTRWPKAAAPFVPAVALLVWWSRFSEAGRASSGGLKSALVSPPLGQSLGALVTWTSDVFHDTTDEGHWLALMLVVLVIVSLSQGDRLAAKPTARALVLVPVACALGYFFTGESLGPVWLFAQRFPVLGLFMLVPILPMPRGLRGAFATVAMLALAASSTINTCKHFIAFEREEVGDIDDAIDAMEPGKRVAALIYDKYSSSVNWPSFLHFGSYYQVRKGGLVQFSYAEWAHWPFRYKEGAVPPPGHTRTRWEWTPEQVPVQGELYPYYDYVLARGTGFTPPPGTFHRTFRGSRWTVWKRDGS